MKPSMAADLAGLLALRFIDFGNLGGSLEGIQSVVAQFFGATPEEAHDFEWEDLKLKGVSWDAFANSVGDITDKLQDLAYLPEPEGVVRVLHTFGLNVETIADRWAILDLILREGVLPQPEGRGKYSEDPYGVFGIVADHEYRDMLYNKHLPWIVADIPEEMWPTLSRLSSGLPWHGNVIDVNKIPAEYIVGINGYPPRAFRKAYAKWGAAPEGLCPRSENTQPEL